MNSIQGRFAWLCLSGASLALPSLTPVLAAPSQATDRAEIIASRGKSNAGIAAHDATRATQFHIKDVRILASTGALFSSAEEMRTAFAGTFAEADFITFVRTPSVVDVGGSTAAEQGRWVGKWRTREVSGNYLARWSKVDGRWMIRSETFIPLRCMGAGCDSSLSTTPKR